MTNAERKLALIFEFCTVIEKNEFGDVFYIEDDEGFALVNGIDLSCSSVEEFRGFVEAFR